MSKKPLEGEIVTAKESSATNVEPKIIPATSAAGKREVDVAAEDAGFAARAQDKMAAC
ncbi:MAG: hypothetical protein ACN6I5_01445 [Hyphomicrobiales bacterium]